MTQPIKIKTNIKFYKGLDNMADRIYGFVTKAKGSWRGCRKDDECKKKIVFVDVAIANKILLEKPEQTGTVRRSRLGHF